ncbi:2-phospho-L-lactate transferase [Yaniella flava]|uniref:2-phospho-L-lactate transferase n=1 Tax=Yaniella flava TaxID=287930 RepID=A0ABP5FVI7_9MICC|nr:2-phospho-L-lactate transferase [Micrococcaceae bacterium]
MRSITVLAGGVGGAKFTQGLLSHLAPLNTSRETTRRVSVIANTGDDMWLNGLRVCPDLDTLMYTLGGGISTEQGWGRANESRRTSAEIAAYGRGWDWFTLGDLDLGTHIVRTDMLREGYTLTEVTELLCRRWQPGVALLPMSDEPIETHVRLAEPADEHDTGELIHFEEWWVRYRAGVPAQEFVQVGQEMAQPTAQVLEAINTADVIVLPPSNPVVSIGTILGVHGMREALRQAKAPIIGLSPMIGGTAVRGMADQCLESIGVDSTASAVALHYGARADGGLLDGWLVDTVDAQAVPELRSAGIQAQAVPLWMTDVDSTAAMAQATLELADAVR